MEIGPLTGADPDVWIGGSSWSIYPTILTISHENEIIWTQRDLEQPRRTPSRSATEWRQEESDDKQTKDKDERSKARNSG